MSFASHPYVLRLPSLSSRNLNDILQGESLARGPKLLSMYTDEQRGFLVHK